MKWLSIAVLALLACAVAGCPEPPPVVPSDAPRDGGLFDAPRDTSGLDVPGMDAPAPDDVPGLDAPLPDAPIDAPAEDVRITLEDVGSCSGGGDPCACSEHAPACTAGACPDNVEQTCISDGCGMVCVPRGAPCDTADDCPPGAMCKFNGTGRSCSAVGAGCLDSRECPRGFACVAGACSDRRVGCGGPDGVGECPYNFFCDSSLGPPHCTRVLRPCSSALACPVGICADVDGDTDRECIAAGACDANTDCSGGTTCESLPVEVVSSCGDHGPCRTAADCGAGMLCQDLWGDGVRECVEPGGACDSIADCASGICGTPSGGGPPTCLTRAFPL